MSVVSVSNGDPFGVWKRLACLIIHEPWRVPRVEGHPDGVLVRGARSVNFERVTAVDSFSTSPGSRDPPVALARVRSSDKGVMSLMEATFSRVLRF